MLFDNMTEEERVKFLRYILNYHKTGEEPGEDTERLILISFKVFKADYDISQDKYKAKVHRIEEINNRRKASSNDIVTTSHDIVTTSHDIVTTSHDIVTTCEKSSPNTYHNNTTHITEEEYKEEAGEPLSSTPAPQSERYTKFISWFGENCPHLKKMEQPTEDQFFKLLEKAGNANKLQDILLAMENNKETPSKRRSVYLTATNWLNRDLKK